MSNDLQIENWLDAANAGDLALMKNLINGNPYTDINATDRCGSSALHYAAEEGWPEMVKFLVEKGGIINAMNMWDKTPLHSACAKGHIGIVRYLVDHGARIEATSNKKRFTPLHLASQFNHHCIVEYLLENGADANAQAEDGKTPLEVTNDEAIKLILCSTVQPLNDRERLGRERRNSEAFDANMEQMQRELAYTVAEFDSMLRLKAEREAEEERKKRELEEIAAEKERIKREEEEAFAEKERLKRIEAENIWAIESAKRQEEEALRIHEKRLFDAANAAAEYPFFKENVLAEDAERDRLEREREFEENEKKRLAKEAAYAEAEREHVQRIKDELAAEEERKFRENAAAEAEIRRIQREEEAINARKEAEERIREAVEAEEQRILRDLETKAAELETRNRELENEACAEREEAARRRSFDSGQRKRAQSMNEATIPLHSDWVPMRWQVEAAEKKQREEDEINRVIAEKAKERLIAVIINPDDYYGCDLPNVPYALLSDWTKGFDASKCISVQSGVSTVFLRPWGETGGEGKRYEGVVGDEMESQSFSSLSSLPCAVEDTKHGDELDLHLEEAQRRFRHVAIKRLVTKISDFSPSSDSDLVPPLQRCASASAAISYTAHQITPRCASAQSFSSTSLSTPYVTPDCAPSDSIVYVNSSSVQDGIDYLHSFRHPNIIRLLGYSALLETAEQAYQRTICPPLALREGDARDCLIYEIAAKGSVARNLEDDRLSRKMTWRHRIRIAAAIACALNYLHLRTPGTPHYHKNIKAAKVVLTAGWCPKLVDVGLIRDMSEEHPLSQGGMRLGTPSYMCPQYSRTGRYEERSEIYSFGLFLAELISGVLQSAAADSGVPLDERIEDIAFDARAGPWPVECQALLRALASECLLPYSRRVSDMATIMIRLRALETTFCPRSEDIVYEVQSPGGQDSEHYKNKIMKRKSAEKLDTIVEEGEVQCGVCALNVPFKDGVQCRGSCPHFLCDECFDGVNLRHQLAVENAGSFVSHGCRLVCELCLSYGEITKISDDVAAEHLSLAGFSRYMKSRK